MYSIRRIDSVVLDQLASNGNNETIKPLVEIFTQARHVLVRQRRALSDPAETGLVGPERFQNRRPKGGHIGVVRPSDLESHGVFRSVAICEFLGESVFLTLIFAAGVGIDECPDAAQPESFEGNRLGTWVPCLFGAEAGHKAPDFSDRGVDVTGDGGVVN